MLQFSTYFQGWEFAHSLISLKSNEQLWAIRSDRSRQMSNRERIAQVAQRKWATVSDVKYYIVFDKFKTYKNILQITTLQG